jgi:hypothetical protein
MVRAVFGVLGMVSVAFAQCKSDTVLDSEEQ